MAFFGREIIKDRVKIISYGMIKNRNCKICVLPDSVEIIGESAFNKFTKLRKLIFIDENGKVTGNKIREIGEYAFYDTDLSEFYYSSYLEKIDLRAFWYSPISKFEYHEEADRESNLKKIGCDVFDHTNLTNLVIPPSLTELNFNRCESLICKDRKGSIVPANYDIRTLFEIKYLKEVSLLGVNLSNIQIVINNCKELNRIYMDVNQISVSLEESNKLETKGRVLHFVLCGETEVLDSFVQAPDYSTITTTIQAKVKKITQEFFNGIANEHLEIPEGVEEIEGFPSNLRNLKQLSLPSTLKKISIPISNDKDSKTYAIAVNIYANIPDSSYQNLCSYLAPSSTIRIHSNQFTPEQKDKFKSLTPADIKIKFVKDRELILDDFAIANEKKIETKSEEITKTSPYQKSVDELQKEILNVMQLLPDDLKKELTEYYNQMIEDYYENRRRERENILKKQPTFGVLDSSSDLYVKLFLFLNKLLFNQNSIAKLKEIAEYRNLFSDTVEEKQDNTDSISAILQNLKFESLKLPTIYQEFIYDEVNQIFSSTAESYQIDLRLDLQGPTLSLESENTPMETMKKDMMALLTKLETKEIQSFIELENAFLQESEDTDIKSLGDHIQTINCAMKGIANRSKNEEWEQLKQNYRKQFFEEVTTILKNRKENNFIRLEELKKQFTVDLKNFVDGVLIMYHQEKKLKNKFIELKETLITSNPTEERKNTVSSLLVQEIMTIYSKLEDPYPLQENICSKVKETFEKIDQKDDLETVEKIMQEFYKDLTDIWVDVYELYNHQSSEIKIQKI